MTTSGEFVGRTAIVTGAASGIGYAIASQLTAGGAHVYALDREASGSPPGTVPVQVDVSDPGSMAVAFAQVVEEDSRIDILCNNAAINAFTELLDADVDEFDRIMAVNARGVFIGMKLAIPHMIANGGGSVVNTASTAAVIGILNRASYSASKGAVVGITRQVAVQYADRNVRCNCICPGTTDSPMVAQVIAANADPAEARRVMEERQPMRRMATPDEIADAAVYLASDRASYITGQSLVVDGGWVAS